MAARDESIRGLTTGAAPNVAVSPRILPTVKTTSCPVCGGAIRRWRTKTSAGIAFNIDRCSTCAYAFVNPRPDEMALASYYADCGHGQGAHESTAEDVLRREAEYPNATLDARRIIARVRKQAPGDSLLEVGCGYGFFSREALRQGFRVTALELGSRERRIARQIAGIDALNVSFEQFSASHSFACVLLSQVLEHVFDVNVWIAKCFDLLLRGGVLCIALPNFNSAFRRALGERDPYISPPTHLNFFTPTSLERLVLRHGFQVTRVHQVSRIPGDLLSRSIPVRGIGGRLIEAGTRAAGALYAFAADHTRSGMMLNLYAVKPAS